MTSVSRTSASDSPDARHITTTTYGRGHRWVCECGKRGKLSYEMKRTAAHAGWAHERAMNARP
jgi:hypothetical protein